MKIKVPAFVVEPFHQKKLSTSYASSTIKTINDLNVDLILNLIKTFAYQTIHSYRTRKRRGRSRYYRARLIYDRVSHFAFRKSLSRFAIRSRIISRCTREKHFKFLARKFSKTILRLPGGIAFMFLKRNCGRGAARRPGARRKGARTPQFFRSGAGAAVACCEKVGFTSFFRVQIRVRVSRASGPAILSRK